MSVYRKPSMRASQAPNLGRTLAQSAALQSQSPLHQQMLMSQNFIYQQNELIQRQNAELQQLRRYLLLAQQQSAAPASQLQEQCATLQQQYAALQEQYTMLEEQYAELQKRHGALQRYYEFVVTQYQKISDSGLSELQEKYDAAVRQNKQFLAKLKSMKHAMDEHAAEADELREKYEKYKALSVKLSETLRQQKQMMMTASQQMQNFSKAAPSVSGVFNKALALAQISNIKFELQYLRQSCAQVAKSVPAISLPSADQISAAVNATQFRAGKLQYSLPTAHAIAISKLAQASCQIQESISQQLAKNDVGRFKEDFYKVFNDVVAKLQLASMRIEQASARELGPDFILKASYLLQSE